MRSRRRLSRRRPVPAAGRSRTRAVRRQSGGRRTRRLAIRRRLLRGRRSYLKTNKTPAHQLNMVKTTTMEEKSVLLFETRLWRSRPHKPQPELSIPCCNRDEQKKRNEKLDQWNSMRERIPHFSLRFTDEKGDWDFFQPLKNLRDLSERL